MTAAFWILVALIAYAYAGYPLLLWIFARVAGRPPRVGEHETPAVSILVPAYNEERVIGPKLANLLSLDYPADRVEILVASESDDRTDAIVREQGGPRVRLFPSSRRLGKVANLHRVVPEAKGDLLVFTDANAMLRPEALRTLVRNFADPAVGSVSGRLVYSNDSGAASAAAEEAYWSFEMMVKRASSDLGSLPGANGSLFAIRRELYRPISEDRGDDFELPIRVILAGRRSILEPRAISVEAAAPRYADEFRRKARIINWMVVSALILLGEAIRGGRPLLAWQLLSHKINRWLVPVWLLLLLPASAALAGESRLYAAAFAAQAALYAAALGGWAIQRSGRRPPAPLSLPLYFVVVNAASFVGLLTRAAGRQVRWHKRAEAD